MILLKAKLTSSSWPRGVIKERKVGMTPKYTRGTRSLLQEAQQQCRRSVITITHIFSRPLAETIML